MKPTICIMCGKPMSSHFIGNVNMCDICGSIDNVVSDPNTDAMKTALKLINNGKYWHAGVVLKDQIEKNERSAMNH